MPTDKRQALLKELARGIELAFDNAEKLYGEGELLRKSGFLARAYFCHQISLEECGKIEIIGGWITHLFLGGEVDIKPMTKAFRSHQAKNYANAYFAAVTPEEREARDKGDLKRALAAFEKFQQKFHEELNTAKNASLYVDYKDGVFSAPSELISDEAVAGIGAVNAYFLGLTWPKIGMAKRMATDDKLYRAALEGFGEQLKKLRDGNPQDMEAGFRQLMDEMLEKYKKPEKEKGE